MPERKKRGHRIIPPPHLYIPPDPNLRPPPEERKPLPIWLDAVLHVLFVMFAVLGVIWVLQWLVGLLSQAHIRR